MYDWCYLGSKNLLGWCLYPRSGGRDLTASGSYPYEFGHRVARLHTTFMESKPGYGVTSDLDALFKSGYQDCTLYQLTGCFCCEPLSVWICLWCGLGVNVYIYIYIGITFIYWILILILNPIFPFSLGCPATCKLLEGPWPGMAVCGSGFSQGDAGCSSPGRKVWTWPFATFRLRA